MLRGRGGSLWIGGAAKGKDAWAVFGLEVSVAGGGPPRRRTEAKWLRRKPRGKVKGNASGGQGGFL